MANRNGNNMAYARYIAKRHRYNWRRKARVLAWVTLLLLAMCVTAAVVG